MAILISNGKFVRISGHVFAKAKKPVPPASEGLSYSLISSNMAYAVSGIGTCTDTDIVIPSTYNNLPVRSIGNYAFYGCSSMTSVTIPYSVTSIGQGARSIDAVA